MYAEELQSIGSNMKLGAQLDVGRSPSWHRLKDIYGEDCYLVSEMGVAEVKGVQEHGGMTMGKHMGAYNTVGDTLQTAEVDEQTLHTAYLQPFEKACREAKLSSIMTSYNTLNGYFTASNRYMQIDVARDMWGWKGSFTTDAGGGGMPSFGIELDLPFRDREMLLDIQKAAKAQGKNVVAVTYGGTPYTTEGWVEEIRPGETRPVSLHVAERELCYWDIHAPLTARPDGTKDKWVLAEGQREVMIGAASNRILYRQTLEI